MLSWHKVAPLGHWPPTPQTPSPTHPHQHSTQRPCRLAAEQGAQEERQRSLEVARGLKADLSKREAQVASLRQELQQVRALFGA